MKKYRTAIILFVVFEAIAVTLWLATGNLFFLLNFTYIGTCIGVGGLLVAAEKKYAREFVQFGVGAYMLVFLGLICKENMQIEGFWYYLLSGVAGAGVLHYAIAKIFGPLLFGRGWCGYACWTAMILDLLPYKQPQGPRRKLGFIRYIIFAGSLVLVLLLMHFGKATTQPCSCCSLSATCSTTRSASRLPWSSKTTALSASTSVPSRSFSSR